VQPTTGDTPRPVGGGYMTPGDLVTVVRSAGALLNEEGARELTRASRRFVTEQHHALATSVLRECGGLPAARAFLRARRRAFPGSVTDADPFKLVLTDPQDIQYVEDRTPEQWGRVRGGSWDQTTTRLEDTAEFQGIRDHFVDDVPWEETAKWERYVHRLKYGETPKGCTTREELRERLERVDEIYDRIQREGYCSQRTLWERVPDRQRALFYKHGRMIDPRLDEITVTIGRDGRLFHRGRGDHRLTIARVLELPEVPVLVRTRHARWQAIRDSVSTAESADDLPKAAQSVLEHPALRDLCQTLEQ